MSINKSHSCFIEKMRCSLSENIVDPRQCITVILNAISVFPLSAPLNFIAVSFYGYWIFSGFINLILAIHRRLWICSPFGPLVMDHKAGEINGSLCWHDKCACNCSSDNREVDWLELPADIVAVIADRLSSQKEIICFGAVCRSWQSIYTVVKCRRSPRLPLLMLATEHNQDEQTRSFYSLTERRVCNTQVPVPANRYCAGSSQGWLVTVSPKFEVSLLDPFNGNEIQLPPLQAFEEEKTYEHDFHVGFIYKAILSADPITEPNYVVLAIYGAPNALAFFKPGNKIWVSVDKHIIQFVDAIYYRDQFYALTEFGEVFVCDLDSPNPKLVKLGVPPPLEYSEKSYLVESSGELLQVVRHFMHVKGTRNAEGKRSRNYFNDGFDVFKLDKEKLEWVELQKLDGRILFVGDNYSVCLLASDYPECKPNSIYYTDDNYSGYFYQEEYGIGPHDMGIFSFDDLTIEQHYPVTSNMIHPAPIWVEPTRGVTFS